MVVFTESETDHFKSSLIGPGVGGHPGGGLLPPTKEILLPGAAAAWFATAVGGATNRSTATAQFGCELPPQPTLVISNNTAKRTRHDVYLVFPFIVFPSPKY